MPYGQSNNFFEDADEFTTRAWCSCMAGASPVRADEGSRPQPRECPPSGRRGSGSCAARPAPNTTLLNARPEETTVTAIAARFGFFGFRTVLGGIAGPIRRVAFGDAKANSFAAVAGFAGAARQVPLGGGLVQGYLLTPDAGLLSAYGASGKRDPEHAPRSTPGKLRRQLSGPFDGRTRVRLGSNLAGRAWSRERPESPGIPRPLLILRASCVTWASCVFEQENCS
jgi:hypothetical protein